jgi:multicomponent K+:H+ antiporter subunit G
MLIELLVSALVVIGAGFVLIGAVGLVRLPDYFTRLHAPTKASTLGVGCVLFASLLHFSSGPAGLNLHELLVLIFLFVTAPISAQLLAKTTPLPHQADDI